MFKELEHKTLQDIKTGDILKRKYGTKDYVKLSQMIQDNDSRIYCEFSFIYHNGIKFIEFGSHLIERKFLINFFEFNPDLKFSTYLEA